MRAPALMRWTQISAGRASEDFPLDRVPPAGLQSLRHIAVVRMGFTISATDLIFGYTLGLYLRFANAILVSLVYSVLISITSILIGVIGVREHTSFALSSRFAFGKAGSRIPSIVVAASSTAFYGYILGITIDVFPVRSPAVQLILCIVLGGLFIVVCGLGFSNGLRWGNWIAIPLMIALVIAADIVTIVHAGGIAAIVNSRPAQLGKMGMVGLIGLGVAKWSTGSSISPDILRFGKNYSTAVWSTVAEFLVGNFGFNFLGIILGLGLRTSGLGTAFGLVGLSWLAVVAFVAQGFTIQTNNLYNVSLSLSNALRMRRMLTNVVAGIIGIGIAYYGVRAGIIPSFLSFLGYVAYAVPAISGIMIADYYVVRRMRCPADLNDVQSIHWQGVVSYVITVGISVYLGVALHQVFWYALPLLGVVIYLIISVTAIGAARARGPAGARGPAAGKGSADDLPRRQEWA